MVVACSPHSAAAGVIHHTGPLTDVSLGMLGWSVLQRRRQTPEALEAEQVSSAHPPQGTWLPMVMEQQVCRSSRLSCSELQADVYAHSHSAFTLLVSAVHFRNSALSYRGANRLPPGKQSSTTKKWKKEKGV